jgi:hypothetical protein
LSSDPTTWGVQTNGFVVPTAHDILLALESDELGYVDPNLDIDADSPQGQANGIFAAQLALAWEAIGALEAARSRDGAEGALLDEQGKLTGTARDGARATVVPCQLALEAGTLIEQDALASIVGHPELTFYPNVDEISGFTAPATGSYNISFVCTQTGPIVVSPSTLTVITTPISGWTSITNAAAGVTGAEVATDAQARQEQEADLMQAGSSTAQAIQAALPYDAELLTGVPGVLSCSVLENYGDYTDENGLPGHSIEVVIYNDSTEDPDAIAAAIWAEKPAGIVTYGALSGSYTDVNGTVQTVRYSKTAARPVYLVYTLTKGAGYVGDTAVKAAIVAAMIAKYTETGADVNALHAHALPLALTGVLDVTAFALGFAPGPTGMSNLSVNVREIATFDVARVTII